MIGVTSLSLEEFEYFKKNRNLDTVSMFNELPTTLVDAVKEFYFESTGSEIKALPVLTKYNNKSINSGKLEDDMLSYLETGCESYLSVINISPNKLVSVSYNNLLKFSELFENCKQYKLELLKFDFKDVLKLGTLNEAFVISFTDSITKDSNTVFKYVDKNWNITYLKDNEDLITKGSSFELCDLY